MLSSEEVSCKLECQDLVFKFATYRDYPEKVSYDSIYTDDAVSVAPGFVLEGEERRRTLEAGAKFPYSIIHIFTNVVIEPTGPDTAKGSGYLTEYKVRVNPEDPLPRKTPDTPRLIGDRLFEFRKTEAGWRISRFERIHVLENDLPYT